MAVLVAGPLLVATTAMLAVRSAHKGVVSGEGDFMIIQNVMTTLVLGLLIFLAFLLKNRRKLHGSLLLSTTIVFMDIALFFALTSFVPPFRSTGFDQTFDGFQLAGIAGQATCLQSVLASKGLTSNSDQAAACAKSCRDALSICARRGRLSVTSWEAQGAAG